MSEVTPRAKHAFGVYTDEPIIGMDHPLFMAKSQARIAASLAARDGQAIHRALPAILAQARTLFGDAIPSSMITAEVSLTYAEVAASLEDEA